MPGRDWYCQLCTFNNFAKRSDCGHCGMTHKSDQAFWWCQDCGGRHAADVHSKCPNSAQSGGDGKGNPADSGWMKQGPPPGAQQPNWNQGGWKDQQANQQGKGFEGWNASSKWPKNQWSRKPQQAPTQQSQSGWQGSTQGGSRGWWNSQGQDQNNVQGGGGQWQEGNGGQWQGPRQGDSWKSDGSGKSGKGSWPQQDSQSKGQGGWDQGNWNSRGGSSQGGNERSGKEKTVFIRREPETRKWPDSWTQECDGCHKTVPCPSMKKTYQLGGNTRKEVRCPACYDDFQHGIYHTQMLGNAHGTVGSVDKFDNWARDPEIKAALCTMVEKCTQQLGFRWRPVPENAQ